MILEAMKMQNEINAPTSGTVSEINCSPGSSVEANMPLIVIKPDEKGVSTFININKNLLNTLL